MANLTYAQLKGVWLQAAQGTKYDTNGLSSLMAAIAEAESSGNPDNINPADNNGKQTSWGLWQISNGTHGSVSPNWNDPVTNAQLAIQKLNTAEGLSNWGTYDSGAYKAYLNNSTSPASVPQLPIPGSRAGQLGGNSGVSMTGAQIAAEADKSVSVESACAWSIKPFGSGGLVSDVLGHPSWCVLSKSQARGLVSAGILVVGGGVFLFGVAVLVNTTSGGAVARAFGTTFGGVLEVGGAGLAAAGLPEVGAPVAAAGAGVKRRGRSRSRATSGASKYTQRKRREGRENQAEDRELAAKGASNIETARKPPGTLGKPTHPGRKVGTYNPDTDNPPF